MKRKSMAVARARMEAHPLNAGAAARLSGAETGIRNFLPLTCPWRQATCQPTLPFRPPIESVIVFLPLSPFEWKSMAQVDILRVATQEFQFSYRPSRTGGSGFIVPEPLVQ